MASEAVHQMHSPPSLTAKRPKGILKNSFHRSPPQQRAITTSEPPPPISPIQLSGQLPVSEHELSDRDITLQNTLQNAGRRRSSSGVRPGAARRKSSHSSANGSSEEEQNQRLKWDEANLYLTEQEKSATMKIDEPKTPYAKHYDPAEDDEEMRMLDAGEIKVDELEMSEKGAGNSRPGRTSPYMKSAREEEIPGLSLGEPEEAVPEGVKREKAVHVNGREIESVGSSKEEQEKHKRFEEMRKKHYEMKDVAGLLGHPEELDDMIDEDGDEDMGR